MATLRKRRNKWEARVRRSGFKTISKSFIKKTDADAWARHIEICFDRGEIPAATSETQKTQIFFEHNFCFRAVHLSPLSNKINAFFKRVFLETYGKMSTAHTKIPK